MAIQIIIVFLFALNIALIWYSYFTNKLKWYRVPASLLFSLLPFILVFFPQPAFELDYLLWIIGGVILIFAGLAVSVWAEIELRKVGEEIFDVIPQHFLTTGPYRSIRHPHYLGLILMWVGWWWAWAAAWAFYFGMFILLLMWMEAYLEEKYVYIKLYGAKYNEHRKEAGLFWIK